MRKLLIFAWIAAVLLGSSALAQSSAPSAPPDRVVHPEVTRVELSSLRIEGEAVGPQHTLIVQRQRTRFDCQIQVRAHFRDRLTRDTGAL